MTELMRKLMRHHFPSYGAMINTTHVKGRAYLQLFLEYPELEPFYSEFEKDYDAMPIFSMMKDNAYVLPFFCVICYLLFCYYGQRVMSNYKPFRIVGLLAAWNLSLALFSAYGAIRTVPHILHRIATMSFEDTICEPSYIAFGNGAAGLATQLFILSKIPELVDTVFIVLRKKPLIFLHWYHHVTVLLYCWNAYVTESSAGIYFVSMNYTVHAVMYFYYFLQAIRYMPKWFPSWVITIMQISQMIIGTFIVCACWYFHLYGGAKYPPGKCRNTPSNLAAGTVIYSSYLYLFLDFAVRRFIYGAANATKGVKATKTL